MSSLNPGGRVSILIAIVSAGLVMAGLGFALPLLWKSDRISMLVLDSDRVSAAEAAIPPIDRDIPSDLETATFAFG